LGDWAILRFDDRAMLMGDVRSFNFLASEMKVGLTLVNMNHSK
jgi:hypothetical protein